MNLKRSVINHNENLKKVKLLSFLSFLLFYISKSPQTNKQTRKRLLLHSSVMSGHYRNLTTPGHVLLFPCPEQHEKPLISKMLEDANLQRNVHTERSGDSAVNPDRDVSFVLTKKKKKEKRFSFTIVNYRVRP